MDRRIAQALVLSDASGPRVIAQSADLPFAWQDSALTMIAQLGRRPSAGVRCPSAIFARPLGKTHVAIGHVADQYDAVDSPLLCRFLFLNKTLYKILGDPFAVSDEFPVDWQCRGVMPDLIWPPRPLPPRTVEELQRILKSGDVALLLGGTQALLDGGRLLIVSDRPETDVLRSLWALLPDRTRCELWPASFVFSRDFDFHVAVIPVPPQPWPPGLLTAEQARDYPEGRYELAIQTAIESGNQADLDRLLARRTSQETLRLAVGMLIFALILAVAVRIIP
jgi:hypothetical protein